MSTQHTISINPHLIYSSINIVTNSVLGIKNCN